MTEEFKKDAQAADLWREVRDAWREESGGAQALDPLVLAAYLDGTLQEEARLELEARLAADSALLDEVLALRALEPVEPPTSVILRAQGLVREAPKPAAARTASSRPSAREGRGGWFGGGFLQPLGWAGALAALVVVCGLSFELGREGWTAASGLASASIETPFEAASEFPL